MTEENSPIKSCLYYINDIRAGSTRYIINFKKKAINVFFDQSCVTTSKVIHPICLSSSGFSNTLSEQDNEFEQTDWLKNIAILRSYLSYLHCEYMQKFARFDRKKSNYHLRLAFLKLSSELIQRIWPLAKKWLYRKDCAMREKQDFNNWESNMSSMTRGLWSFFSTLNFDL